MRLEKRNEPVSSWTRHMQTILRQIADASFGLAGDEQLAIEGGPPES